MCIGIPMRVLAVEPGHAQCAWRGESRRVRTALVGEVQVGDWLLVFIDSAQERLAPDRAAEIDAVLSMLQGALDGPAADHDEAGSEDAFALPSRWTTEQLRALSGAPSPLPTESLS
jgi:hydrogenase expression/formation protein HypC